MTDRKNCVLVLKCIIAFWIVFLPRPVKAQQVTVRCMGIRLDFDAVPEVSTQLTDHASEDSILYLKNKVVLARSFKDWITELRTEMKAKHVPDWCMIPIIDSTFNTNSSLSRLVIKYSALALSGFWPVIYHRHGANALAVWSSQDIVEKSRYTQGSKWFYLVDGPNGEYASSMSLRSKVGRGTKSFSLISDREPIFEQQEIYEDTAKFYFEDASGIGGLSVICYDVNREWLRFLEKSPKPDFSQWPIVAVSEIGKQKLLRNLSVQMPKDDKVEALNFLLAFTAWGFKYMEDEFSYGMEKPLYPEQTLAYPYSDCEDRVFLFAFLVDELLGMDVVYIDYPDHLAAAVDLKKDVGQIVKVKGKTYSICNPVGGISGGFRMGEILEDFNEMEPIVIVPAKKPKIR